jgi:hypothetical protein
LIASLAEDKKPNYYGYVFMGRFTDSGELEIDNNSAERTMRLAPKQA